MLYNPSTLNLKLHQVRQVSKFAFLTYVKGNTGTSSHIIKLQCQMWFYFNFHFRILHQTRAPWRTSTTATVTTISHQTKPSSPENLVRRIIVLLNAELYINVLVGHDKHLLIHLQIRWMLMNLVVCFIVMIIWLQK